MNDELKKRLLGLLWGSGVAAVVAFLAVISNGIKDVGLPEIATLVVVLVCEQATKYLNKKYQFGARILGKTK